MMAVDRFDAMTAFVTVAEQRGFPPAARALGLSPSVVTRLVAGLEDRLGVRLLQRTTRAVSLTDPGARYLERAREILADLDEAERIAESAAAAPSGRLTVTAPLMFGRLHVGPLLCRFMRSHPAVSAELMLNDRWVNLVEEGIDLALRIGHLPNSTDIVRRMGETRRVVVAAPHYIAERGEPGTPEDLSQHRIISVSAATAPDRWRFIGEREVPVSPAFVTNGMEAGIWHALNGGGLVQILSYQVAEAVAEGALVPVLTEHEPEPLPIQFVYPSSRLLSVKVRALIDRARSECHWGFVDREAPVAVGT